MNAEQFYEFCVTNLACSPGLAEIKGLTPAEWWNTTERGDWMLWLRYKGAWAWPKGCESICLELLAEPLAECRRALADAQVEFYDSRRDDVALAKLQTLSDRARGEYARQTAQMLRKIVGNPFTAQIVRRILGAPFLE